MRLLRVLEPLSKYCPHSCYLMLHKYLKLWIFKNPMCYLPTPNGNFFLLLLLMIGNSIPQLIKTVTSILLISFFSNPTHLQGNYGGLTSLVKGFKHSFICQTDKCISKSWPTIHTQVFLYEYNTRDSFLFSLVTNAPNYQYLIVGFPQ